MRPAIFAAAAFLAGCGSASVVRPSASAVRVMPDYANAVVVNIQANGAARALAALTAEVGPSYKQGSAVETTDFVLVHALGWAYSVTSAECVQQSGTEIYDCEGAFALAPSAGGGTPLSYLVVITGTCTDAGVCQWDASQSQLASAATGASG